MATTFERIQLNRKTAAQWTATNTVLLAGEAGVELDTGKVKFGDGTTAWTGLPYSAGPTGGGSGAVSSVAGRTGDVTLTSADVGLGNVSNTSDAAKPVSAAQATALAGKVTYPAGGVDGQVLVKSGTAAAWTAMPTGGGGAGGANSTADHIRYVSKSGSDANSGLSWSTPYLTVAAALTALATSPGIVYIAAGTFDEAGLVINQQQRLIGAGRYATTLRLTASGTLVNLVNQSDGGIEDLTLAFASSAVTGRLLYLSNSFRFTIRGVRFTGTTTAGQIGTHLDANAGDSNFYDCYYASLGVHVQNDTAVNYWYGGSWGAHATAGYQSGDPTGADTRDRSAVLNGITFLGSGPAYVNLNGYSAMHTFNGCWWDGSATTAIIVGGASFGPKLVVIRDSPNISGASTSLLINRVGRMVVDGNLFGDTGTHPTVVSIPTPANVPNGWCGQNYNLNAATIASFFPASWKFGA